MRSIIVILFLALFLILSLPFLGIEWLLAKKNQEAADMAQLRAVQWAFKVIIALSGIRLTVIGEENVPKDEPVLYIGNHRSFFDVVISYSRCPRRTGYISKDSIKKVPILSIYMERLYCLFLDRQDTRQGLKVILKAIEQIKNGISMCIYPEGTRNKDKEHPLDVAPFKEGSFKVATKSGCKIIPMAILGSDNVLENHFPWIRSTEVVLIYGTPIDPKAMTREEQKTIGLYTHDVIVKMLTDYVSGKEVQ